MRAFTQFVRRASTLSSRQGLRTTIAILQPIQDMAHAGPMHQRFRHGEL